MAMDYDQAQLALRVQLQALSVLATASTTLEATATGYVRTTGSFLADGFAPGMEVTPAGFATNDVQVVKQVETLTLTVDGTVAVEAAAGSRTLSVLIPSNVAWENIAFTPPTGSPWFEEQLVPGGHEQLTIGDGGTIEALFLYVVLVHVPINKGVSAHNRYADALLALMAPRTILILTNGDKVRARSDVASFRGQLHRDREEGFVTVAVTWPCRLFTINS